jgi:surface antigen
VLDILPRDGIAYTVKAGDTIQSIADKYKSNASLITTYNDLEISGVSAGAKIIIPGGDLPTTERPGYTAPITRIASTSGSSSSGSAFSGFRSGSVGNKYAYGNCTWWAYERRAQMGRPVGSFWGNGGSWAFSGRAAGFLVNNVPAAGAVLVEAGSPGHVGIVESVNGDGSIVISEMNNAAYGGFNIVNNRTISAGQAAAYQYVH